MFNFSCCLDEFISGCVGGIVVTLVHSHVRVLLFHIPLFPSVSCYHILNESLHFVSQLKIFSIEI